MVSRIAERVRSARDDEDGFTIIEVMVAMTIFALIAAGVAAGITSSLVLTNNSRAKEVASTIAMDDIDGLRDLDSIFDIKSTTAPLTKTVGGREYSLTRSVIWTRSSGSATACGTGDGTLSYKAVTETVSWKTGSSTTGTQTVTMSTAIAPLTNINSDTTGSILIGVTNASGTGVSGIVPTITGPGAATVPATDAEGCTYVSGVTPGTYTVKISRSGYVDSSQQSPSTQTVVVSAGASGAASFSYDLAAIYAFKYATTPEVGAILPTNMPTTLINPTSGTTALTNTASSASVFPYPSGYRVVAGTYAVDASGTASTSTCLSPEPGSWTAANPAGKKGTATSPSATSPITVQMGAVTLSKLTSGQYLTAKTTTAVGGDPGCAVGMTLTFPRLTSTSATIALPWGTWKVYSGSSSGSTTTTLSLTASNAAMVTNGSVTGGAVMVDPRPAG